ncbi:hypothetical protein [Hymenobacter sp. BT491]|uniref:hypothetical protein n=1 Tax=Hymenobacter sp. BT491 TaxID=2766779 RepID=UPI0016534454|nr:hypothetical protein [Hymenobacter sp. BT491]MBC6989310.1 hypothetical protein [Hymenobacter sp. BT491]
MSTTRLKRKHRKNIARQNNKQRVIKQLLLTPVLKNVDLDELKSRFNGGNPTAAAPAVASAPAAASTSNKPAQVNQTGTEGFDEAEAITKPVNEDGQEGEHPKPEIAL